MLLSSILGCSHPSTETNDSSFSTWRVLERVGNVRASNEGATAIASLRPGDTLASDHQLVTGKSALLILAGDGIQITTGKNTSLQLSATSLFLNHGWVRIRLTRAVNRKVRIQTTQFDLSASSTMMILRAAAGSADVTVETGSVRLATSDGRHQATLVAGAAAKIDHAQGDDLLIRPAFEKAFARQQPLSAAAISTPIDSSTPAASLAISPASRLNDVGVNRQSLQKPDNIAATGSALMTSKSNKAAPTNKAAGPLIEMDTLPGPTPDGISALQPVNTTLESTGFTDPLELQFDRLTKGLVDQL